MLPSQPDPVKASLAVSVARRWLDQTWWLWLIILLGVAMVLSRNGYFCRYSMTDFRGYYASAQIAWQQGFARVYHQPTQDEYQANLPLRCPDGTLFPALLRVSMPYLPVFALLFLPVLFLDFSSSYIVWTVLNLLVLVGYSWYFCRALAGAVNGLKLFQWIICLPLFASLTLGQMNVFLVVCLGEFTLALLQGKELRSGFWLAGMLLKPHTLILFLPGLLLARRWKVLGGFLGSFALILAGSYLLAGMQGMRGMFEIVAQFASPVFHTAPVMMNWRALAINLQSFTPAWFAWAVALVGMLLVGVLCLSLWRSKPFDSSGQLAAVSGSAGRGAAPSVARASALSLVTLILATYAATASIAWHSHFYMLLPMIPSLVYIDCQGRVPAGLFALWVWGPLLVYGLVVWINPDLARNALGLGMLGLNLAFFAWLRFTQLNSTLA